MGLGRRVQAGLAYRLHRNAKGFRYMRLSEKNEGHISNYQRVIDGFLAGLGYDRLLPAMRSINVHPLEMPVLELDI